MWLAEVKAKAKRKNQIFFSKDSLLLEHLRQLIGHTNRRALVLWALELAEETALQLTERYPEDLRPGETIAASRAWAAGEIKMSIAKRAILNCHAMAKELTDPATSHGAMLSGRLAVSSTRSVTHWDILCMS